MKLGYSESDLCVLCGSTALLRKLSLVTAIVTLMSCGSANAHHSFAAEFDGKQAGAPRRDHYPHRMD